MGLEERLNEDSAVTISLEQAVNWARKYSVWPLLAGLACCAMEQIGAGVSRHDISRFGSEVFRGSPRQADLLIVSGRVSQKMGPVIKRLYDQMQEPKWVIAMGICASSGGPFNNYAIVQLSLIHISEPTRLGMISYAVFCLKKKKKDMNHHAY